MKKATPEEKLKELIVYIATKCSSDENYGETKLNKILYYSDFLYFFKTYKPITGYKYVHLPRGPIPDDMKKLLKKMQGRDIDIAIGKSGPYIQNKIIALREPDLSLFSPDMISHVDTVIDEVCNKRSFTANQLSELSHRNMGWLVTSNGEHIPYETVFVKDKKYQVATEWEINKAKKIAKEYEGRYGYPKNTQDARGIASL